MEAKTSFVTRFAPSPNGWLHLGHAYSALLGQACAQAHGGQFLLRIEDIDTGRARPHFIDAITQDLEWLGLSWPKPVMHQSVRFDSYEKALDTLRAQGLIYPCWATRTDIARAIEAQTEKQTDMPKNWPRDPDGAPFYPGLYRNIDEARRQELMWQGRAYAWRLDMARAMVQVTQKLAAQKNDGSLSYVEWGTGIAQRLPLVPQAYGDVVLARKDIATSYHLAVVVDDGAQGITQVTRGQDLQPATAIHRLLQVLLGLPEPEYLHHALIRNTAGRRLSKQAGDGGFRALRQSGVSREEVIALLPPLELPDYGPDYASGP